MPGIRSALERSAGQVADLSRATVYATEGTIEVMHQQAGQGREQLFDRIFPGQIPETPVLAEPVPAQGFRLEGNPVMAVETGHTDTGKTSVLHVPSIGLVVAGDVAYNGVHQYIRGALRGPAGRHQAPPQDLPQPRCRVAFYDRSRNASGVWHSVRICGNAINLRAHRERRRAQRK